MTKKGKVKLGLKAPFPWFGGKRRVADKVWERFGDVRNYVEPFAGSLAVLLERPHQPHIETVNDLDCHIANFWRALKDDCDGVVGNADWPVNEADLHARHFWLNNRVEFRKRMHTDPDYYDVKIAGWWVWGLSQWIGAGWCSCNSRKIPHLGDAGRGVHRIGNAGRGKQQRPHLSRGRGVHRSSLGKRPHLGKGGMGVHRGIGQRPHLRHHDMGVHRQHESSLVKYLQDLSDRLRYVRVCCGDWERVLGPSPTEKLGVTAVFLDPPYGDERQPKLYSVDDTKLYLKVRDWAIAHGDNPKLRIALCGYETELTMPDTWTCLRWKAGGYDSQSKGQSKAKENTRKEIIWFSPHCLTSRVGLLGRPL